jgi:hypothetical protein
MLSLRRLLASTNTPPSKRAIPEEWAWWCASGWEMLALDAEGGWLLLFTSKKKLTGSIRSWGTQEQVRHFLTTLLCLIHTNARPVSIMRQWVP